MSSRLSIVTVVIPHFLSSIFFVLASHAIPPALKESLSWDGCLGFDRSGGPLIIFPICLFLVMGEAVRQKQERRLSGPSEPFKKRMGVWHLGISGEKSISRRAGYRHISTLHILKEGRFRLHFRGGRMRRIRQMARKIGVGNQRNRSAEWTGLPTSSAKSKAFALHRNDGRSGCLVD